MNCHENVNAFRVVLLIFVLDLVKIMLASVFLWYMLLFLLCIFGWGIQNWFAQECAARASKPLPNFKLFW